MEVKKNAAEARRLTGRTVLQRRNLELARIQNAYAVFVYPENEEATIKDLKEF